MSHVAVETLSPGILSIPGFLGCHLVSHMVEWQNTKYPGMSLGVPCGSEYYGGRKVHSDSASTSRIPDPAFRKTGLQTPRSRIPDCGCQKASFLSDYHGATTSIDS